MLILYISNVNIKKGGVLMEKIIVIALGVIIGFTVSKILKRPKNNKEKNNGKSQRKKKGK